MGKKNSQEKNNKANDDVTPEKSLNIDAKNSIIAIVILSFGLISLLGLFNSSGKIGSFLSKVLTFGLGYGKWLFPLFLLTWSLFLFKGKKLHIKKFNYVGLSLFFISVQSLFHFFIDQQNFKTAIQEGYGGGYIGYFLALGWQSAFGFAGGIVLLLALFFISLILTFNTSLSKIVGRESWLGDIWKAFASLGNLFKRQKRELPEYYEDDELEEEEFGEEEIGESVQALAKTAAAADALEISMFKKKAIGNEPKTATDPKAKKEVIKVNWKTKAVKIDLPLDLLSYSKEQAAGGDIAKNMIGIKHTLDKFGIPVEMGETSVGPTVTQYTFKPAEGIKVSRITALSNDLSLALAAHPIRIEAPIPGKALVGVEVPNKTKATVGLREILEDKEFKTRKNNLMIALGKDVAGANWLADITRMPHLLVAGATNSGKSVCLNAIIISLLYQNNPSDLRFIMVDPKRVELPAYNGIPHLLTPVITEVSKTINALRWCLNEMDRRYDILNQAGKKNIQSYNEVTPEKMPYIIFVIDELADLMVTAAKDIEGSIIRLTQMARAVGIHLVLATQRPSVDVITGLIKANVPTRIAFSVASAVDSKTILDSSGAEKLLGKGDMLFSTAELSKPKRIRGAYVSDEEIGRITSYIKNKYGEVDYIEGITERQKVGGMAGVGLSGNLGDEDELLEEAKEIVVNAGKASTSLLQRRLSIGYGRAAKIIDLLEDAGVVGAANGSKPREIMISKEEYVSNAGPSMAGMPLHNRAEASAPSSYLSRGDISAKDEGNDDTLDFEDDISSPVDSVGEADEEIKGEIEDEAEEETDDNSKEEIGATTDTDTDNNLKSIDEPDEEEIVEEASVKGIKLEDSKKIESNPVAKKKTPFDDDEDGMYFAR